MGLGAGAAYALRAPSQKKNTHLHPSRQMRSTGLDGRRILCGRWADWLGSAMKPLTEYGKEFVLASGSGPSGHKKTHFRVEVGLA